MDPFTHWETIYTAKEGTQLGWYRRHLETSLAWIQRFAPERSSQILDAGGGASTLVDDLLAEGYRHVTVLDLSPTALERSRARLGDRAGDARWIAGDLLEAAMPEGAFDLWHDRAVFHFLTRAEDRARYAGQLRRALRPGGHAILATFAPDGPPRCSGLDVVRYDARELIDALGPGFRLVDSARELHRTPSGGEQWFSYAAILGAGSR